MTGLEFSSATRLEQADQQLDKAIEEFRSQLFRKTPDDLGRQGSCLRLKETARRIASLLVKDTGQHKLPIDLDPICARMLIHTLILDADLPFVSELAPDSNGFTVRISGKEEGIRRRVGIAHEVGHTLFYDTSKLPPTRIFQHIPPRPQMDKQEWISWDFARELLLPQGLVVGELNQNRYPSTSKIVKYAKRWGVSVELLCHRIIHDLRVWKRCVLLTFTLNRNRIDRSTVRIYRGREFPQFHLLGKEGLLTTSNDFAELVEHIPTNETLEKSIVWQGLQMWVQLLRYSEFSRVIGALEIPTLSSTDSILDLAF